MVCRTQPEYKEIGGDSWLLVVESQIANLIPDLSFGHNLCFNYPNGSCKPILDIYIPWSFQWYKDLFNPMGFDLCNLFFEDSGIHQDSNFQSANSFESVGVHFLTFFYIPESMNVTLELHS